MCIICVGHYTDSRHGSLLVVSFRFAAFFSDYIRIAPFDRASHSQFGFSHSCNNNIRGRGRGRLKKGCNG